MLNVDEKNLQEFALESRNADFLLVGEMHGSRANAPFMRQLAEAVMPTRPKSTIAFEWTLTSSELDELRLYINGGAKPKSLPSFFEDSDGRFTYEHASFLKWVRELNLKKGSPVLDIFAFDTVAAGDPEEQLAAALEGYKKSNPDRFVLVETGSIHARAKEFETIHGTHVPMGALLKRHYRVLSLFLSYLSGEINVEGENLEVSLAASQQEGPSVYFDATFCIPHSEAAESIYDLTRATELL